MDIKYFELGDRIKTRGHYGNLWWGRYRHHKCVLKVQILTTGIHYDQDTRSIVDPKTTPPTIYAYTSENRHKLFPDNGTGDPYNHVFYANRRPVNPEDWEQEIKHQTHAHKLDLAPKVYTWGYSRNLQGHRYGYLVMAVVDKTLANIHRPLSDRERQLVRCAFHTLNTKGKMLHRDTHKSNIGVFLNDSGEITKCHLLDFYFAKPTNGRKFDRCPLVGSIRTYGIESQE